MNSFIERLRGVIGFPVTPWDNELEFDEPAFRSNVDFLLETGLAALAFCGSNGEIHSVTLDEYERIAKIANEMNQGRKALIFGVGQTLRTAEQQARIARASGADAIMAMAPYMADANEPGLAEYYRRVAGAAGIPVFLYQTKWSGILPLSLLGRLTDVENIGMVKDENGNLSHYLNVRKTFGDRFYWVNGMAEPFVPSYWNLGVKTFTSGLACFMPDVTMRILQMAREGDFVEINRILNQSITPLYELRNRQPGYKVSMIKSAMTLAGLSGGRVRPPLTEMSATDHADLEELMVRLDLRAVEKASA